MKFLINNLINLFIIFYLLVGSCVGFISWVIQKEVFVKNFKDDDITLMLVTTFELTKILTIVLSGLLYKSPSGSTSKNTNTIKLIIFITAIGLILVSGLSSTVFIHSFINLEQEKNSVAFLVRFFGIEKDIFSVSLSFTIAALIELIIYSVFAFVTTIHDKIYELYLIKKNLDTVVSRELIKTEADDEYLKKKY